MTYNDSESSVASGVPVELYHFFSEGEGHFRQTSVAEVITHLGYDWSPLYRLERTAVTLMGTSNRNEIEIVTDRDNPAISSYISAPPEFLVYLIIYRGHGSDFIVYRNLVLTSVTFKSSKEVSIKAEPKTSNLRRVSKQRISCRLCNIPLYGSRCGVNQESYKIEGTLSSVDGITLVSSSFTSQASGWLTGGKIVVNNKWRMILTHVDNTITVTSQMLNIESGDSFRAYAGCDHASGTCKNKFSNLDNYWGDLHLPSESLYTTSPIVYSSL